MCNGFYIINSHIYQEQVKMSDQSKNYTKTKKAISLFGNKKIMSGLGIYGRSKKKRV